MEDKKQQILELLESLKSSKQKLKTPASSKGVPESAGTSRSHGFKETPQNNSDTRIDHGDGPKIDTMNNNNGNNIENQNIKHNLHHHSLLLLNCVLQTSTRFSIIIFQSGLKNNTF